MTDLNAVLAAADREFENSLDRLFGFLRIPSISAEELIERDLPDLIIERTVIETMPRARHTRRIQIINGLKPQLLRRALDGEHVGTIICADTTVGQASSLANNKKKRTSGDARATGRNGHGR